MEDLAQTLQEIVKTYGKRFCAIPESELSQKPATGKWSRKEVIGHLIDSASNNLRRFITGQYEQQPPHIIYNQDFWVKVNDYQSMQASEVISLWILLNNQIATIIRSMPAENRKRLCNTGTESDSLHSLEWLAEDYIKHLKHHINQVIPGSFDITYP